MEDNNRYHKPNSNDYQSSPVGIKGWLLVFFILSGLAMLSNIIIPLIDIDYAIDMYKSEKIFWCIYVFDILTFGFLIYTLYTFIHPQAHAIHNIYDYMSLIIIGSVFKTFGAFFWDEAVGSIIFNVVWAIIWVVYFMKSNYIDSLIPKDTRERNKSLSFLTIIFLIPMVISAKDLITLTAEDLYFSESSSEDLLDKSYGNNRISFTVPEDFKVSIDNSDGEDMYTLENMWHLIVICEDSEFASYSLDDIWEACIMSEFSNSYRTKQSDWHPINLKNNECYLKTSYITSENETYYANFYVLYNDFLNDACVFIAYSHLPDKTLYENILNSVKFKN